MTAPIGTSSSSRESILASIRKNLAASVALDDAHTRHRSEIAQAPMRDSSLFTRETLLQNFTRNLRSVGGHYHFVRDESEASEVVRTTIESLGSTRIAISDSSIVGTVVNDVTGVEIVGDADRGFLFASDIGITSAQWGIAETGTLVLESDTERHRLTSLVPPVHVCILKAENIRQTLGEILELVHRDLSRTVTFITGASRTSDIELTLAIGVHGPRELHVIVVEDQRS
jgi:L-lactate dehydrogenase complex protein LldG